MAGDWTPRCKTLNRKPEVLLIARLTGMHRRYVAETLQEMWAWADDETEDGFIPGVTLLQLSEIVPESGDDFWRAVVQAGWIVVEKNGLRLPNFQRWMGRSAKRRLKDTKKKRAQRSVPKMSRRRRDKNGTTEQNRTEQNRTEQREGEVSPSTPLAAKPREGEQASLPNESNASEPLGTPSDNGIPSDTASDTADTRKGKPKKPRPRDELFDVLAEVTGSDTNVSGSHLGRVCKALRAADPPYTVDEVRAWAVLVTAEFRLTLPPGLGMVEKYIGLVRATPIQQPAAGKQARRAETAAERLERVRKEQQCRTGGANG